MSTIIHPTAEQLPEGTCSLITSEQTRLNLYAQYLAITLSGDGDIVVSATAPSDHTKKWLKLDSYGRPTRLFIFAGGAWLSLHPLLPGFTMIWTEALPTFTSFDGGDTSGVLSDVSGAMWEEVTDLRAKFPVGAGTLPSGTVLSVDPTTGTATGGEETHLLTTDEIPEHVHGPPLLNGYYASFKSDYSADNLGNEGLTNQANQQLVGSYGSTGVNVTTGNAHANMPPFFTVYFLRRTARLFYRET